MDSIAGAKILTERLLRGRSGRGTPSEVRAIAAADALPLFHWTGVEPSVPSEVPPQPERRRRRWRRSR